MENGFVSTFTFTFHCPLLERFQSLGIINSSFVFKDLLIPPSFVLLLLETPILSAWFSCAIGPWPVLLHWILDMACLVSYTLSLSNSRARFLPPIAMHNWINDKSVVHFLWPMMKHGKRFKLGDWLRYPILLRHDTWLPSNWCVTCCF